MACMTVTDTGIGIRPEYLQSIGTKYTQQESGRTRPYDGLGIGLAITRAIIDRHGGSLQFESTIGAGTSVRILLPILHT
jgi:signal transduction histidine kinase